MRFGVRGNGKSYFQMGDHVDFFQLQRGECVEMENRISKGGTTQTYGNYASKIRVYGKRTQTLGFLEN